MVNAFDLPARQTFVVQLVDRREDLGNAIALNSSMFNLARLLGPALAGLLIAAIGTGYCYLVDAISYVAVLISLWRIRPRLAPNPRPAIGRVRGFGPSLGELRDGFAYAFGFAPIGNVILLVAATAFTGFAAPVLMPVLARDVFGGDARTLGWLMSASGLGALGAALYLSTRVTVRGLGDVITGGGVAMGVGVIGVAFCRTVGLGAICMLFAGAGGVLLIASSNTIVQSLTDDDKRGRVMSLFAMAFTGTTPLGNLAIGALAGGLLGVRWTLVLTGACCALAAVLFYLRLPALRVFAAPLLEKLEAVAAESVTT